MGLRDLSVSPSPALRLQACTPFLFCFLSVGTGDPNSGPHTCLPTQFLKGQLLPSFAEKVSRSSTLSALREVQDPSKVKGWPSQDVLLRILAECIEETWPELLSEPVVVRGPRGVVRVLPSTLMGVGQMC